MQWLRDSFEDNFQLGTCWGSEVYVLFARGQVEVCHILFTASVEYTEVTEIAGTPPPGCTELPTCPVCLLRVCQFCQQQAEKPTCSVCGTLENLWICVICGFIGCGRYKERHAIQHWKDTQHCYSLDLETQRVWDYDGDTYVHRLNQSKADGKLVELSFDCRSLDGDCGTYNYNEESGISGTLLSSKIETIVDEYNHLLMSQLESQRQYYEKLLTEAKGSKQKPIAEAVDKALNSKVQKIQLSIEKCVEENKIVASINESLVKDQKNGKLKVKEIEERRTAALRLKDEKIRDLEEQIRDLTVYIEAQKTLEKMTDADEIRGGTVLPVLSEPSTSGNNNKRRTKINRRRT